MLVISKNKSKSSQAVVKFTKKTKPVVSKPMQILLPLQMPLSHTPPLNTGRGVQSNLTEAIFRQYLVGFVEISPRYLPATIGKWIRYAIDMVDSTGRIVSTKYRLGGVVKALSGNNVLMFNPYSGKMWTLKTTQPSNKRLRLYLDSPNTNKKMR